MKISKTFKEFCKIKRKFYKKNTIKRVDHINGKRFVSYWEKDTNNVKHYVVKDYSLSNYVVIAKIKSIEIEDENGHN